MEGLFADPRMLRQERLDDMAGMYEDRKGLSLLQQVAGGRGAQLAESTAGMFGLRTAEEGKAANIMEMRKGLIMDDPEHLGVLARELNNAGYTEEALKVLELRSSLAPKERDVKSSYGKIAFDEGLKPNTPEFIARVLELQQTDKAGAEAGVTGFTTQYDANNVAYRTGINKQGQLMVSTPEGWVVSDKEFVRSSGDGSGSGSGSSSGPAPVIGNNAEAIDQIITESWKSLPADVRKQLDDDPLFFEGEYDPAKGASTREKIWNTYRARKSKDSSVTLEQVTKEVLGVTNTGTATGDDPYAEVTG